MTRTIDRRRLLGLGGAGLAGAVLAPTALQAPASAAGTALSGWGTTVFEDNFTGTSLDTSRWIVADGTYRAPDWGWLKASNVTVSGGALHLGARRLATPVTTPDGRKRAWSSAEIRTRPAHSVEHGRWEFRAKLPAAPTGNVGLWTGVWLRPDRSSLGGEIDIAEAYGSKSSQAKTTFDPSSRAESSVHFNQKRIGSVHAWSTKGTNIYSQWNVWAAEKTPAGITFFFNGTQLMHLPSTTSGYSAAFPAGTTMNLRVSFQVGNSYWGVPDANTISAPELQLDYLRVWKYQG